jgi:hypothetical protein
MRRRLAPVLLVALLLGGLAGGCAAPTIPLPPPSVDALTVPVDGVVLVTGEARVDTFVAVFNVRLEEGVIVRSDADGAFAAEIRAASGDTIRAFQFEGGSGGQNATRVVP